MTAPLAAAARILLRDLGNRGIGPLFCAGDFEKAVNALQSASSVVIMTGFVIPAVDQPENDGPVGAVSIAAALASLGKHVSILSSALNEPVVTACVSFAAELYPAAQGINICSADSEIAPLQWLESHGSQLFPHTINIADSVLLTIELPGPGASGICHNMRGVPIPEHRAFLHGYFSAMTQKWPQLQTIGIGDGGNEVGMGKVRPLVEEHVAEGSTIACHLTTDYLIVSGVSNWAGYALHLALFPPLPPPSKAGTENEKETLASAAQTAYLAWERQLLQVAGNAGAVDGVFATRGIPHHGGDSMDGILWNDHVPVIEALFHSLCGGRP
jgi:hypothetical protein